MGEHVPHCLVEGQVQNLLERKGVIMNRTLNGGNKREEYIGRG